MSQDQYQPFSPAPISSTSTASGVIIEPANAVPTPGNPTYRIYCKWARLHIKSISSGTVTVGGGTTSDDPILVSGSDVGVFEILPLEGIGVPLTTLKDLTYTATGSNLNYSIKIGIHKVIQNLG